MSSEELARIDRSYGQIHAGAGSRWRTTLLTLRDRLGDSVFYLLPTLIFSFRFLEWWYADNAAKPAALPVPQPPQSLPPLASGGVAVPSDHTLCPLCSKAHQPPAPPTGYVFVIRVSQYVRSHGACPVTGARVEADSVCRLYDDST